MMVLKIILPKLPRRTDPPFAMDVPTVRPTDIPTTTETDLHQASLLVAEGGRLIAAPWIIAARRAFDESFQAVRIRLRQAYHQARLAIPLLAQQDGLSPSTLASIMVDRTFLLFGMPMRARHARPRQELVAA